MKQFAGLIYQLETSNKTKDKIDAIVQYLATAPAADKIWLLALFTGKRPRRPVNTTLLRAWALERACLPEWLFLECYSNVGDLGETISLILPEPTTTSDKPLHQWIAELSELAKADDVEKKRYVMAAWDSLERIEKFIFNKLIGGGFRVGVSYKLLVQSVAKSSGVDESKLMHSLMGKWDPTTTDYDDLISGIAQGENLSAPYPFCLAYAIEKEVKDLGKPEEWQAEYKWDGIRGQLIKRKNEIFIWSRGEELVTTQFPELVEAAASLPDGIVLDGEILAYSEDSILPFNSLQKRLNRKLVSKKMRADTPIHFFVYDLLEHNFTDIRHHALSERRTLLEELLDWTQPESSFHLSPVLAYSDWSELKEIRAKARDINSEGIMLKQKNSLYHTGRKKGDWWKWKVNPLTIDAVLIYAQKGSGRRSRYYTDYTFGIRDEDKLVTIAKAYSGLTDKEILEVNRFINKNSLEKFGPVRTVKPELVFEIGFEGIGLSNRHKAGVALRFPRIMRWRKDKSVDEIDTLEQVKALIPK